MDYYYFLLSVLEQIHHQKGGIFFRTANQVHAIANDPSSPDEPTSKNKLESDMLSSSDHTTAYISSSLLNILQGILLLKNEQKVQGIAFEHNHNYPVKPKNKRYEGPSCNWKFTFVVCVCVCLIQDTGYKFFFSGGVGLKRIQSSRPIKK